jgi:hypothetical protein
MVRSNIIYNVDMYSIVYNLRFEQVLSYFFILLTSSSYALYSISSIPLPLGAQLPRFSDFDMSSWFTIIAEVVEVHHVFGAGRFKLATVVFPEGDGSEPEPYRRCFDILQFGDVLVNGSSYLITGQVALPSCDSFDAAKV